MTTLHTYLRKVNLMPTSDKRQPTPFVNGTETKEKEDQRKKI